MFNFFDVLFNEKIRHGEAEKLTNKFIVALCL
jgi:hypothetical protein